MKKPPINFLIDSFIYEAPIGVNDWNEPIYDVPIEIERTRIDRETVYTVGTQGKEVAYNAVVFCYQGLTTPLPEFEVEGKITFDGKEHRLVKIVPVYEPYRKEIYAIELEVV